MAKTRINISLDKDLAEFAKIFAAENRTSVADLITQFLLSLKRRVDGEERHGNPDVPQRLGIRRIR